MIKPVEAVASLGKAQDPALSGQYKAYSLVLLTTKAIFTRLYSQTNCHLSLQINPNHRGVRKKLASVSLLVIYGMYLTRWSSRSEAEVTVGIQRVISTRARLVHYVPVTNGYSQIMNL